MSYRALIITVLLLTALVSGGSWTRAQTATSSGLAIELNVAEPANLSRTADPVTTGLPIPLSATQSQWALFDGQTEIPVQTTLLPGIRTPWLLLDFQSSVNANTSRTYTLREQAPTVSPTQPINIFDTATTSTITTGPLKAVINRTTFNLFDEIWLDRDNNSNFEPSEQVVFPTTSDNLPLRQGTSSGSIQGADLSGRGTPTAMVWESAGPVRATLKVEGTYGNASAPLLRYTTRITFYAGRRDVTVEHVLRNSFAGEQRYVKVQSAKIIVGGSGSYARVSKSGSQMWSNVNSAGSQVELIPSNLEISTQYDPYADPVVPRVNTTINVDQNGGMLIGDWSYHGASVRYDFTENLTGPQQTQAASRANDRLVALAPASWYSDLGAFGSEHFGTLEDEQQTYQRWGWQWPTPGNLYSSEPYIGRVKDTFRIDWNTFDAGDFEADDVWMNLMMYIRTRSRGYLDRADAMARYWKWEFAWRTDNFHYIRQEFWSGPNQPTSFPRNDLPTGAFTASDTNYVDYNIKSYGKNDGGHSWNGGILDYYYLFGDHDALATAIDIAEHSRQHSIWRVPESPNAVVGGNVRGEGRQMLNTMRVWEATNDSFWKTATDNLRNLFLASNANWDSRGFYYGKTNDIGSHYQQRMPNAKYFSGFMLGVVTQSFYRYWILTGDAGVRDRIITMANFALVHGHGPEGYTGDYTVIDWPNPGEVVHMTYDEFRNPNPTYHYSYSSSSTAFIDTLVLAYRFTGNQAYLTKAKFFWDKASKRRGTNPFHQVTADQFHVGRFLNSLDGWVEWSTLFPSNGDLTSAQFLFFDAIRADDTPPGPVNDLAPSG